MAKDLTATRPEAADERVLWDVVTEHLDEAEYFCWSFEQALQSSVYRLDSLAKGPERWLQAHVDGLVLHGEPALARLLAPAAAAPNAESPGQVTAVALALIGFGRPELLAPALFHADPGVRAAVVSAGGLAADVRFDRWVLAQLAGERDAISLTGLLAYVARRGLAVPGPLFAWLQGADPALLAAAARATAVSDPRAHLPSLEGLLDHPDAEVSDAALVPALATGSARAWSACWRAALAPKPRVLPACLLAALGAPADHAPLWAKLGDPSSRKAVLFALSFCGDLQKVPALIDVLSDADPMVRRLAAQAIAAITGLDLEAMAFQIPPNAQAASEPLPPADEDPEALAALPKLEDDSLDSPPIPPPELALPEPDRAAIVAWWNERSGTFDTRVRHLGGQPWSPMAVLSFLTNAPLRLRHVVAQAVGIRSGLALSIDTQGFVATQRSSLQALTGVGPHILRGRTVGW